MLTLFLLLLILPGTLTGLVVGVKDGDTMTMLVKATTARIRLFGIDCPEKKQAFGQTAKKRVSALCYHSVVSVETRGKDAFGRTLGIVYLRDGRNLNQLLVSEGLAWWYKKYSPRDRKLESLQTAARKARRGVWSIKNPIPPWEFRKRVKQMAKRQPVKKSYQEDTIYGSVPSE